MARTTFHRVLPLALLLVSLWAGLAHSRPDRPLGGVAPLLTWWTQGPDAPTSFWASDAFYEGPSQTVKILPDPYSQSIYQYTPEAWSSYATTNAPASLQIADPLGRRYLAFTPTGAIWDIPRSGTVWTTLAASGTPPSQVADAVFDPVRNRALVFASGNTLWQLDLEGAPAWSQIGTYPASTFIRRYDPIDDRVIAMNFGVIWSLPLDVESPTWTSQAIGGTAPPAYGGFVHDLRNHRLLNWGGGVLDCSAGCVRSHYNGTHGLNLTGAPAWIQLNPSGSIPAARFAPTAAYDHVQHRLFITGGYHDNALAPDIPYRDTWTLQLDGAGPGYVDIDPPSVDFGEVSGPGAYQRTIEVSASGAAHSVIFAIVSNNPHVTVDARAFALAPGESRVVTIEWDGVDTPWAATIEIESTDATSPHSIPVTGHLAATSVGSSGERGFGLAFAGRNPSTGPTRLDLTMSAPGQVVVTVHDLRGSVVRRLAEGVRAAGRHPLVWDGRDGAGRPAAAGVYFISARAGGATSGVKVVLSP